MSTRPLNVAVLGTGHMARTHAKNLTACEDVQLVGFCSRQQERATAAIAQGGFEAARAYEHFDRMLDEAKPDAVVLAIPPHAHDGEAVRAAQRGLHLLLEKPVALRLGDAQAMLAAAESADVVTQVVYQMRFRESVRRLHSAIQSGEAGRPTLFTGRF
jgi:predicted dehydrogenase